MARLLLIEDNELNRDMLSRRLLRAGHEVILARDASEGLVIARRSGPQVIVLDLRLPDMSGWELTRILKDDPRTASIPVIALTAHAMEGDRDKAIACGCDEYDTKPVDLPRLLEKIELVLMRPGGDASGVGHVPHAPPGR